MAGESSLCLHRNSVGNVTKCPTKEKNHRALMVQETWESFVKLPHDITLTMEQVISELRVHGSTYVGCHFPAA